MMKIVNIPIFVWIKELFYTYFVISSFKNILVKFQMCILSNKQVNKDFKLYERI